MTTFNKPNKRPTRPHFSSGPCAKPPHWSYDKLSPILGRSHRSGSCKEQLKSVIEKSRKILGIPDDYAIGIVPASDTGAVEMALWSLLGSRGVDILAWEVFGHVWLTDIVKQLKIEPRTEHVASFGELPDLSKVNFDHDVVFTWNGTTSGVCVPNASWIPDDRKGLTICDATSGIFAMSLDWSKLDVTTWSWQKALGGEGAHGIIALSPRAQEQLKNYTPSWPIPKIFRLTKNNDLIHGVFVGETINTPSMLCVADVLYSLEWVEENGGLSFIKNRSLDNYNLIKKWVQKTDWVEFIAANEDYRSNTSVTLKIVDDEFKKLDVQLQRDLIKKYATLLAEEHAAYDIAGHRDGAPGLRIWAGGTVDKEDIHDLLPWLDWGYQKMLENFN